MKPTVAVIIVNWNRAQLTLDTISSILKISNNNFNFHIFLVDNGSSDNSFSTFHDKYNHNQLITIIKSESNLGFVGGNNLGISQAMLINPDYFLLLNNDVIVDKNFLSELIEFSINHPKIALFGPKIYFAPGFEYHQSYSKNQIGRVIWSAGGDIDWNNIYGTNHGIDQVDEGQFDIPTFNHDFLTGCCLLITKKAIAQVGLLDSKYFLYLEDADYCQRCLKLGLGNAYVPKSVIWHLNSGSSSPNSKVHDYFLTRNRLLFGIKYASFKVKILLLIDSIRILSKSPSIWQKRAVLDFYFLNFGHGSFK